MSWNRRFAELWRVRRESSGRATTARSSAHARHLENPDSFLAKVRELYAEPEPRAFDVLRFRTPRSSTRLPSPAAGTGNRGRVWSFRDVTSGSSRPRPRSGIRPTTTASPASRTALLLRTTSSSSSRSSTRGDTRLPPLLDIDRFSR